MSDRLCPFIGGEPCLGEGCEFEQSGDCLLSSLAFMLHELITDVWEAFNDGNPSLLPPLPVSIGSAGAPRPTCDKCKKNFLLDQPGSVCREGVVRRFFCSEECVKAYDEAEAKRKEEREHKRKEPT